MRAQRRAAGLTQADLAQRAGMRRQTIVGIEAGKNMEIQTLLAVLAAQGQGLLIVAAQGDLEPPNSARGSIHLGWPLAAWRQRRPNWLDG